MHNLRQQQQLLSQDEQVSTEDDHVWRSSSPTVRRRAYPHSSPIGLQSLGPNAQELLPLAVIHPGNDLHWTNLDEPPRALRSTSSLSSDGIRALREQPQQFGEEWPCASEPYIPIAGANSPELPSSRIGLVQTYQDMPGR
jgi:hypothetical protein